MAAKGRPRLTEEILGQRIADYCTRYSVTERNESGFPIFPAGQRETPQHREWVVLFKALSRLRDTGPREMRNALLASQAGRCPVCTEDVSLDGSVVVAAASDVKVLVHSRCGRFLRLALDVGAAAVDRARAVLWPEPTRARRPR
jgi:hypothetical protein